MSENNVITPEETTTPCCNTVSPAGLRTKDAAAYIGVSTVTLNSIIKHDPDAIPHYYSGGMRIFSKKAIDRWLEKPIERGKSIDLAPALKRD